MDCTRPSRRGHGFTLIELLVVVAIIALLVSIILPAVGRAKRMAKDVVCSTNLRNIGLGWNMYWLDNNDSFPKFMANMQWFYGGKEPSIWRSTGWTLPYRPLNPYMEMQLRGQSRAETFRCPFDREIYRVTGGHTAYEYFGNSYMLNHMLLTPWNNSAKRRDFSRVGRLSDVYLPTSQVVLAGDCQWYYTVNDTAWNANFHNDDDRMNLLFMDGHVQFLQLTRGEAYTSDYSFLPRPPDHYELPTQAGAGGAG